MQNIDVSDLPEPVARAIEAVAQILRLQLSRHAQKENPRDLPQWDGQVLGNLSRGGDL